MWLLDNIILFIIDIRDWFYEIYREVSGWIWPFHYLATPFYWIQSFLADLAFAVWNFRLWLDTQWEALKGVFSIEQIMDYIEPWLDYASAAWRWVKDAFGNVWNIVDSWWTSAKFTVLGWIDMATEGFNALRVLWDEFWKVTWPKWMATLEVLGSNIQDFFTHTLPNLLDYLKLEHWWNGKLFAVDGLIGSKLAEWFPFYDDVAEFFSDPGEFLLSKLTDWFLGPEE